MSLSAEAAPLVKVAEIQGRGRSLIATRTIRAGEVVLSDSPILLYPAAGSSSSCSHCFRTLRSDPLRCPTCSDGALFCNPRCLDQASSHSHPHWVCQTLARLRSLLPPLDPELVTQLHFLIAAYSLPTADFHRLLSLQGAEPSAAPEALALHSLLSSVSPPLALAPAPAPAPAPHGFSPELTAALLAKDKMNAFGVMEPFREEDKGQRRVRAYGIYPNASLFNHDCLPNACRFDYIDVDGQRNTEIVVRALHDIPQGREVCLSYFPVNWSYMERQRRLLEDYGFHCVCDRCEVEKNWKEDDAVDDDDDDDDDDEAESMEEEGGDGEEMEDDADGAGANNDFPHAYFFMQYMCQRENCGGTLAPLPPSSPGAPSGVMECNVCGMLRMDEVVDGDGVMHDE